MPARRPTTAHQNERDSTVGSVSHSRGVDHFLFLLLEIADAVDGGEGIVSVRHPYPHGVVLVGYGGAGAYAGIQDVLALGYEAPLAVLRGVAERGINPQ